MCKMRNLQSIILFAFLCVHYNLCDGNDWHFSLSSMHDLFDFEADHLSAIETYIKNEQKRLDDIKRFIEEREILNAKQKAESYTESSINAFKTILRVKTDWETLNEMAQTSTMEEFQIESLTRDDVMSALRSIRRLQIVYELEAHEIANGDLDGYKFEKLNVNDCYRMASMCYNNSEFHCANEWFDEVFKKYEEDNSAAEFDYSTLIIQSVWSSYLVGDYKKSQQILEDYLKTQDDWTDVMSNIRYIVWSGHKVFKRNTANDREKKFHSNSFQNLDSSGEVRSFINACQDWDPSPYLSCRYYRGDDKFLTIAPLREETIALIPDIKLYHDVLCDDEITKIKTLAKKKLKKLSTDTDEDISLRKVATLSDRDDRGDVFDVIRNRLVRFLPKSESNVIDKFVVTNYGLSGHYLPHKEHIDQNHLIKTEGRQAMIIFQLNDDLEGGHTVIPDVHVRIPHSKGSALIVSNTARRRTPFGAMFKYTQYGSCPIFYGDKWTLTSWIEDKNKP